MTNLGKIADVEMRPGFTVPSIARGCWQLASNHSSRSVQFDSLYNDLVEGAHHGFTFLVCSDLYEGVESLLGSFRERYGREQGATALSRIQIATTYAPGFAPNEDLETWSPQDCVNDIESALKRLRADHIDLIQLHWSDYKYSGMIEAAQTLDKLKSQGKIRQVGVTNMNVASLRSIVESGVDIVSNTIQYSLVDRRPENGMAQYCLENGVGLYPYGVLGGGFLSDKWIGHPEPAPESLKNASLLKYKNSLNDFGDWNNYQELLALLHSIAQRHRVSIANVAARFIYEQEAVSGIIVGAFGNEHLRQNLQIMNFSLTADDRDEIRSALDAANEPKGDCYDFERAENAIIYEDF